MLDTVYAIGDASSQVHSLSYMVYISTFQMYLPPKGFHFEPFLKSLYMINFIGPQSVMAMNTIHSLYNVFKNLSVTV